MSEQEEQSKGFQVTDRRSFTSDGWLRSGESHAQGELSPRERPAAERDGAEAQFLDLLSLLATQASLALGEPDPVAGDREVDLDGARVLISMIEVLRAKTEGNLAQEEETALDAILYALRMRFLEQAKVTD